MEKEKFRRTVAAIYDTEADEIVCSVFFASLPNYVERERAGENVQALLPAVNRHIHQCPECEEAYLALREVLSTKIAD